MADATLSTSFNVSCPRRRAPPVLAFVTVFLVACGGNEPTPSPPVEADPAEGVIGERLFLETRFAQFFAVNIGADVNAPLAMGDPVLDVLQTTGSALPGPFAGRSMSCRQCHIVDDAIESPGGRSLTYSDFARRSPVPDRGDGRSTTVRNSQSLVNASLERAAPLLLHFDGEFVAGEDLVKATLMGRDLGWLPGEEVMATAHIARVIREDDGSDLFAEVTEGRSYAELLAGGAQVPKALLIAPSRRIDVASATDAEVLEAVSSLIHDYVSSIEFSRGEDERFNGSPFDAFLRKNGLPAAPDDGESDLDYQRRLGMLVNALSNP